MISIRFDDRRYETWHALQNTYLTKETHLAQDGQSLVTRLPIGFDPSYTA